MSDWGDLFTNFYDKFVLRDLLSMVLPGLTVFFVLSLLEGSIFIWIIGIIENPSLSLIFILAISYLFGIIFLVLSDFTKIFKTYYTDKPEDYQKISKNFIEKIPSGFFNDNGKKLLQIRERYIVFTQTCGNFGWAIFFSLIVGLFSIVTHNEKIQNPLPFFLFFGTLQILSGIGYYLFLYRQKSWDKIVLFNISRTSEREVTAIHEAGHCIIAERLGYRMKEAFIELNDEQGMSRLELTSQIKLVSDCITNPQKVYFYFKSGDIIQEHFFHGRKLSRFDAIDIERLCEIDAALKIFGIKNHPIVVDDANNKLKELLKDPNNCAAVQEIAHILDNEGEISGQNMREIIKRIDKSSE